MKTVTLTYAITDEDLHLDFEHDEENSCWVCVIDEDEMNRILVEAHTGGRLE